MGQAPGAAPHRRSRRRGGDLPPGGHLLQGDRPGLSHRVRLFHRELEAPGGGGLRHHGSAEKVSAGGHRQDGAGPGEDGVLRGPVPPDAGAAGADRAHPGDLQALRGLPGKHLPELWRAGRDPAGRPGLCPGLRPGEGRPGQPDGGAVFRKAVLQGRARPGPDHPPQRGAAPF